MRMEPEKRRGRRAWLLPSHLGRGSGVECKALTSSAKRNYNVVVNRGLKGGAYMANEMGKRYRCDKCGTELIVTRAGEGGVKCCGQSMVKKS